MALEILPADKAVWLLAIDDNKDYYWETYLIKLAFFRLVGEFGKMNVVKSLGSKNNIPLFFATCMCIVDMVY